MSEYIVKLDGPYAAGYHVGEEIVRCSDCKHADEVETRYAGIQYGCLRFDDATVEPDGFCAWGVRKDD